MKIRIYDDSVRLRLDRTEVDTIGAGGAVSSQTRFPGGTEFRYRLEVGDVAQVTAGFTAGCICVSLPRTMATQWAADETAVSIRGSAAHATGSTALLVEKDFECLEPRAGEDQSNRFVNPKAVSG